MKTQHLLGYGLGSVFFLAVAGAMGYDRFQAFQDLEPERIQRKAAIEDAKFMLDRARNFSTKEESRPDLACASLSLVQRDMIKGNLSYRNVGTTKEKFEMIEKYNDCKFNQ